MEPLSKKDQTHGSIPHEGFFSITLVISKNMGSEGKLCDWLTSLHARLTLKGHMLLWYHTQNLFYNSF